MTFAPPRLIVLLSLVVGGVMYLADFALAPRANDASYQPIAAQVTSTPTLQIWTHATCCDACVVDFARPLLQFDWLGEPRLVPPDTGAAGANAANFLRFDLAVKDPARFDFAALRDALADAGFALEHAHLSGLAHYRVEAALPRLSDGSCAPALEASLLAAVAAARPKGFFGWMDSARMEKGGATFYPRFDAPIDLVEVDAALGRVGFVSPKITVHLGD